MDSKIKILDKDIINKIAAGEVVERPNSILKELLENSIDAKATDITVKVYKGGIEEISVIDNGVGMNNKDLKLAFHQHATSKVLTEDDLYNITTLGFRGEALPSIASISEVKIHSYNNTNKPVEGIFNSKDQIIKTGAGRVQGTTTTVNKIFQDIPVRRKFLKSELTEYRHILNTFEEIALGNPHISFKLFKEDKLIHDLSKTDSFKQRILQLFPNIQKDNLKELFFDGPTIKIGGFILLPNNQNKNTLQYIFINGRFIKNHILHKAIKEGFETTLMHNEQPSYFLFMKVNPDIVDVNVHPRKLEVRFYNPNEMFKIVKSTVSTALSKGIQKNFQTSFNNINTKFKQPSIKTSLNFTQQLLENTNYIVKNKNTPQLQDFKHISFTEVANIHDEEPINDFLQIFNTYILIEKDDKVLVIDQHAAAERINFEKISNQIEKENKIDIQPLLITENITLTQSNSILLRENEELFKKLGFEFKNFKTNSVELTTIPSLLEHNDVQEVIYKMLEDIKDSETVEYSQKWKELSTKLISTIACHSSIRAGQKLHKETIIGLIRDLFNCKLPYSCPHGRPFYFEIKKEELEKRFKRIV